MTAGLDRNSRVAVIGAGTMGSGIAQIAATHGHRVALVDADAGALKRARGSLARILDRLVEKGRLDRGDADGIIQRIAFGARLEACKDATLVIEAVVEDLGVKKDVFSKLESLVSGDAVLATNTSSLSITAVASACANPERVLGVHFFNPAPLMPLVEIVPGIASDEGVVAAARALVDRWGKTTVLAKDTPGFIVNRVARPFYGEALRILEEGIADVATIDGAMKSLGGFRMGPFELMDLIGNDVNYQVTQSVFEAFHYEARYRPSFTQKRLVEAGRLGRKSGRGFYDYTDGAPKQEPGKDEGLAREILMRIVVMLINEAADARFWKIATRDDIDLAMTKGVNYPKGLLRWADEIGIDTCLERLGALQAEFGERYRPSPLLRRMARDGRRFYE